MKEMVLSLYRWLFGREALYRFNEAVFLLSLRSLGILNYTSESAGGERKFLRRFLASRKRPTVIDVGGNEGNYSAWVFHESSDARILAFEPHPQTCGRLKARFNTLPADSFECIQAAVGATMGQIELFDYDASSGSSHASVHRGVFDGHRQAAVSSHTVDIVALDQELASRGILHVDLLKIDTEGNEYAVLQGASQYIAAGRISAIHFEFNEMNVVSRTFFKDFWDLLPDYDFYRLLPKGMIPIRQYSPIRCELFAYQNIVALRRAS